MLKYCVQYAVRVAKYYTVAVREESCGGFLLQNFNFTKQAFLVFQAFPQTS